MPIAYVPVPEDRLAEVYKLLASPPAGQDGATVDEALIEQMYRESDRPFRRLLEYLAERADKPVSTTRVAEDLALRRGTRSLAGMLGAFGRRSANRYGGQLPFRTSYNPVKDSNELAMPEDVAKVIRRVRPPRRRGASARQQ